MEKTAGAIIFRKKWFGRQYLVLQHATIDRYWGLVKGHIEKGETDEQAAIREVQEETGLNEIKIIPDYKEKTNYFFVQKGKKIHKEVIWFLGEAIGAKKVNISVEHQDWKWVSFQKAMKILTFEKDNNLIKKAEELLGSLSK